MLHFLSQTKRAVRRIDHPLSCRFVASVSCGRETSECFSLPANILFFVGAKGLQMEWRFDVVSCLKPFAAHAFSSIAPRSARMPARRFQIFRFGEHCIEARPRLIAVAPAGVSRKITMIVSRAPGRL